MATTAGIAGVSRVYAWVLVCGLLAGMLPLSAFAETVDFNRDGDSRIVNDPVEVINREIFAFNRVFDDWVAEPVARGYARTLPESVRQAIGNFTSNLNEPLNFINSLLQGNLPHAGTALTRFMINSTFGIAGLLDVAGYENVTEQPEDLGQTLAVWGLDDSPYLVLPFLGPSTLVDTAGMVGDWAMSPARRVVLDRWEAEGLYYGSAVARAVNTRAELLGVLDNLKQTSLDYYAATRSFYLQRRQALINNTTVVSVEYDELD